MLGAGACILILHAPAPCIFFPSFYPLSIILCMHGLSGTLCHTCTQVQQARPPSRQGCSPREACHAANQTRPQHGSAAAAAALAVSLLLSGSALADDLGPISAVFDSKCAGGAELARACVLACVCVCVCVCVAVCVPSGWICKQTE
jgi:hypothetical protein